MSLRARAICPIILFTLFGGSIWADEPNGKELVAKSRTVEELAKDLKPSIVVITAKGRESKRDQLGTGFVVDANGIIATNLHVIGEGRPIAVETGDGKKFDVIAIQAIDRLRDLALIKVNAKDLPALPLADSDRVKDGQAIVALGNPQGLKHSVTAGVVSGRRDIDGQSMIQIAIPLEPGNSGGPVVDMQGRAIGVVTLKSLVTENLGFASPINVLKSLIAKPTPIAMDAWVTIGALDPDDWKPLMGANWSQRAGRIKVTGAGSGFGGRSLNIYRRKPPELPYEIAVSVKLDDEKGAAGLLFHHDGDRHYGFYPTGGKLRLTRFEGPDVFSWKILEETGSPHYKPGEWNAIKVRVSKDGVQCFVNDHLTIEAKDAVWTEGQPGLAKFRDTVAEFKQFQVAKKIETRTLSADAASKLLKPLDGIGVKPFSNETIGNLAKQKGSGDALRDRARDLERQAARLRELATDVHSRRILDELAALFAKPNAEVDLIHAGLLLAKLDNEEVDVDAYRAEFERMAKKLVAALSKKADDKAKLATLNKFFFEQRGFHGSRADYYNRSNSYLNEVIDDREGIPITLSVIYLEFGKRIGLKLEGIGMPGHFVVRHFPAKGEGPFIDVFERGETFTLDDAKKRIADRKLEFDEALIAPIDKKAIVVRMLHNLLRVAREEGDTSAGGRYLDGIVMLDADAHQERFMRSVLRYGKGQKKEALEDLNHLLEHFTENNQERKRLMDLKRMIELEIGDN
jgi:regulator of sirC expression with transglutaminase-like and TPR domain